MRNTRVNARYWEVASRIVSTRRVNVEQEMLQTYHVPLAGPVNFDDALRNW